MKTRKEKAVELFKNGYGCAQAVLGAYSDLFGLDTNTALKIACSFGAGMGRMREVCGAVSGMFMVAGLYNGMTDADPEAKKANYDLVVRMADEFKKRNNTIICRELLGLDKTDVVDTNPEKRTETYYKVRPCVSKVEECADIIEELIMPLIDSNYEHVRLIRVTKEEEISEVADIAEEVIGNAFEGYYSDTQIQSIIDRYQSCEMVTSRIINNGSVYYLISNGSEIIGYVGTSQTEDILKFGMYISEKYRNHGYGRYAFDELATIARENNLKELLTTCSVSMKDSVEILKEWGFEEESTIETEVDADCIIKQKVLNYTL